MVLLHQGTPLLPCHIHQHLLFPQYANANVKDLTPVTLDPNLIRIDIGMNNRSKSITVEIVVVVVILQHPPPLLVNLLLLQPAAIIS